VVTQRISNVRDPRDLLPDILSPLKNHLAVEETAYLARETGIDGLRVWFNVERLKFIIEDTKAPGGPAAAYVMVVQNPDGSPADVDGRTVQTIRKMYGNHKGAAEELIRGELERANAEKARRAGYGDQVVDAMKYVGQVITPSVANRERSVKNGN
jgi:hypothetical protein